LLTYQICRYNSVTMANFAKGTGHQQSADNSPYDLNGKNHLSGQKSVTLRQATVCLQ
jgi:hypothetical protein